MKQEEHDALRERLKTAPGVGMQVTLDDLRRTGQLDALGEVKEFLLLPHKVAGAAVKLAYLWLYNEAGWRPNTIIVSPKALGTALGRSDRQGRDWIEKLVNLGLIELGQYDERRGVFEVHVYLPQAGEPMGKPPDPQKPLPFGPSSDPPPARRIDAEKDHAGVLAPKPPQEPPGVLAQEPPRKPPRPESRIRVKPEENGNDDRPPTGVLAPKPPRHENCFHGDTIEKEVTRLPLSHRTAQSMDSMERASDGGGDLRGDNLRGGGPAPIGESVAAAINQAAGEFLDATTPLKQKQRLEARIMQAVSQTAFDRSIAGRAADLVVHHGVPLRDLEQILTDLREMRRAGSLKNAGGFFHNKARKLAAVHGAPWPKPARGQGPGVGGQGNASGNHDGEELGE